MTSNLTARQRLVLEFIVGYIADRGFPPSIREIGAEMGISSLRGVTVHLDALVRKGFIARESTSRGIRVLVAVPEKRAGTQPVPVLGTIAAGAPIPAVEDVESYLPVPEEMVSPSGSYFALRVRGDSMTGDGIMPGDLVIVRSTSAVDPGDLAAVMLGDDATVKRVRIERGKVVLAASNPRYESITVERTDSCILGKVTGLIRSY